jgi:hypothetical protein
VLKSIFNHTPINLSFFKKKYPNLDQHVECQEFAIFPEKFFQNSVNPMELRGTQRVRVSLSIEVSLKT